MSKQQNGDMLSADDVFEGVLDAVGTGITVSAPLTYVHDDANDQFELGIDTSKVKQIATNTISSDYTTSGESHLFITGVKSVYNLEPNPTRYGTHSNPDQGGGVWKSDGTKFYWMDEVNEQITEYSAGTAWDVTTLSTTGATYSISGPQYPGGSSIVMKPDDSKIYYPNDDADEIVEITMSTPGDLSTASETNVHSFGSNTIDCFAFDDDGDQLWVNRNSNIEYYTLNTAWDTTTIGSVVRSTAPGDVDFPDDMVWGPNGVYLFRMNGDIRKFECSTPWDLTTVNTTAVETFAPNWDTGDPYALAWGDSGTKLYPMTFYKTYQFNGGSSSGVGKVTLASADVSAGKEVKIVDMNNELDNGLDIATEGSETINQSSSVTVTGSGEHKTIISDGSNWFVN